MQLKEQVPPLNTRIVCELVERSVKLGRVTGGEDPSRKVSCREYCSDTDTEVRDPPLVLDSCGSTHYTSYPVLSVACTDSWSHTSRLSKPDLTLPSRWVIPRLTFIMTR